MHAGAPPVQSEYTAKRRAAAAVPLPELPYLSPPSVLLESSQIFFTIHRSHRRKKMMDQNSAIFENFLKFSKRRRAVPLRPIWTTMVVAKLDHSRVLVTKFRQNQSTLKGRSAGQRQTDKTHRQTNSAENNGPSGLQTGQQFQNAIYKTDGEFFIGKQDNAHAQTACAVTLPTVHGF